MEYKARRAGPVSGQKGAQLYRESPEAISSTEPLQHATQPGKGILGSFSGGWRDQVRVGVMVDYIRAGARPKTHKKYYSI